LTPFLFLVPLAQAFVAFSPRFRTQDVVETSPWMFYGQEKGVLVLKNSAVPSGNLCIICKAHIPVKPERIFQVVKDVGTLGGVDFMLRASEVLDVLDEATKLVHLTYGSEKCEREHTRDFCAVVHASKEGETKYRVIYRSVLVTKVCCGFCFLNLPPSLISKLFHPSALQPREC